MTLRRATRDDCGAFTDFEAIVFGLTQRMEKIGVERETIQRIDERLSRALEDLRDWPLV